MPKPIVITEKMKAKVHEEFVELLDNLKMSDGKISYSKSFMYEEANAIIYLTQIAYRKIVALVTSFDDEVAWHGAVTRQSKDEFIIEDVYVYPQEVTGSTVNTDWKKYTEWLYSFVDDDFNKIRMQGHSHVNMGVSPSGVDVNHRAEILTQLDPEMYYIFMIWNKALKTHTLIYDMQRNVLYEDDDIILKILDDESMETFLSSAKENIQKKKPTKYRVKQSGSGNSRQRSIWDLGYGYGDDLYYQNEMRKEFHNEYT